jgi:tetratricopeptide (TPR) repeat protein
LAVVAVAAALAVPGAVRAQAPGGPPAPPNRPPPAGPASPHGPAVNTPPAGPRGTEARRTELDRAFDALRTAPDEAGATLVEGRIRQLWASAATPSVSLLMNRGMRNMQANRPGDALEDFDAALTLAPEFPEAWLLRAEAHSRTGDARAAARDIQEVLRLEPRHWVALLSLSALQDESGDAAAALRSVEAALAINPKMPERRQPLPGPAAQGRRRRAVAPARGRNGRMAEGAR